MLASTLLGWQAVENETADEFVARVNRELEAIGKEVAAASWVRATYITPDTAVLAARAQSRFLEYQNRVVAESTRYLGQELSANAERSLLLLRLADTARPAPADPAKRDELTRLYNEMTGVYGEGKYCPKGPDSCIAGTDLERLMGESRDYDQLLDYWRGWHTVSPPMREPYTRFIELANDGARNLGFGDLGEMWRSNYDMSPAEFGAQTDRLWGQVKPLYDELHCYVRAQLAEHYGADKVAAAEPIPAHILGNMWAQEWGNIYDLVEPYPGVTNFDVGQALVDQKYDAVRMTKLAEGFFVSLGMPTLPQLFWERSLLTKPRDREVVCHASAWDMDAAAGDVRIKQCLEPTEDQLITVHHELGHIYYYLHYKDLPPLYQSSANPGFHEGIGDTINLSMTPAYLNQVGLVDAVASSPEAVINQQMKMALDKVAFLPFGKLIDEWRWRVFSGEITPENYNASWWELRTRYQGVAPPMARSEADFDPGAKYHIPANVEYTRYFIARILQFQFHRALCEAAGFEGPLNECSIYGKEEAGRRLAAVLEKGRSRPWPDTLEELTGGREMDGRALLDYFAPLMTWLEERNQGQKCGW
ncbi:MAG: M2 family metallopeptidase [Vicinamibacteria bacterium]